MQKKKYPRNSSLTALVKAEAARNLIDNSPPHLPAISAICSSVLLNRVCLQVAFKERFDISIARYGREVKIRRVKSLLMDYTLTLDSVAEESGYNGGSALSRFFKQMEGVTPGVWRRENLRANRMKYERPVGRADQRIDS
jgi:two-component system, response regulator YesN